MGDGHLRAKLESLIESFGWRDRVNFLGHVPHNSSRLIEEYMKADIFTLPSVTIKGDKEGIPGTLVEAMANGLPVVSTYHAGIPDLITDGYLQGNEKVFIENATRNGIIKFNLPKMEFKAVFNTDGRKIVHQPTLDTLILEPDDNRFSMIWRASERCDKKILKLQRVDIHCIESNIDLEVR